MKTIHAATITATTLVSAALAGACTPSGFTGTWVKDGVAVDVQGDGDAFAMVRHDSGRDAVLVFDGKTAYRDDATQYVHREDPATKTSLALDTFWRVPPSSVVTLTREPSQSREAICGRTPTAYKACMLDLGCGRLFIDDDLHLVLKTIDSNGDVALECKSLKLGKVSPKAFARPWS